MSSNQEEEPGSDVACAAVVQSEQIIRKILQTYQFVQSQASRTYTSKEGADDEEPELDLATIPSIDSHRMKDGHPHPVQV